jgi:hypothetical protein
MAINGGLHNGEELGERDGGVEGFWHRVGRRPRRGSGAALAGRGVAARGARAWAACGCGLA